MGSRQYIPAYDRKRGAFLVQNPYHIDKPAVVSFISASELPSSVTSSRAEFIGTTGTVKHLAAIRKENTLSDTVEAGLDHYSTLNYDIELAGGETKEIIFYLGSANSREEATALLDQALKSNLDKVLLPRSTCGQTLPSIFRWKKLLTLRLTSWSTDGLPYQVCRPYPGP